MFDVLINYKINFWVIAAIIFIILEIILSWSVIFFFIIGSASLIVGIFLSFNFFLDIVDQMIIFFISFLACSVIYWLLFKFFRGEREDYKNMVGQIAHVVSEDLIKGEVGQVKWSGTVCKAMLHNDSVDEIIKAGEKVVILDTKSNILIVKKNF